MKTAISMPDAVFKSAESLAKQLGISRSELFTKAMQAYIEWHQRSDVRNALDDVYSDQSSDIPLDLVNAQTSSLPEENW